MPIRHLIFVLEPPAMIAAASEKRDSPSVEAAFVLRQRLPI
jgi:hypothetical protein